MKDRQRWTCCSLLTLLLFARCYAPRVPASPCRVNCGARKCKFEVSPELHPDEYDCYYSWNNQTDFALASSQGHTNEVLAHTNKSLEITGCMNVTYEHNCASYSRHEPHPSIMCAANCIDRPQGPMSRSCGQYLPFSPVTLLIITAMLVLLRMMFLIQHYFVSCLDFVFKLDKDTNRPVMKHFNISLTT
ncbi:hypothetical protein NQD34_011404 [Periophthalmus magnuspinnatus]|nr:hypothetical protein NQD34_011404 [Periophthalmus magnuspinnatus]